MREQVKNLIIATHDYELLVKFGVSSDLDAHSKSCAVCGESWGKHNGTKCSKDAVLTGYAYDLAKFGARKVLTDFSTKCKICNESYGKHYGDKGQIICPEVWHATRTKKLVAQSLPGNTLKTSASPLRTQKARGVMALQGTGHSVPTVTLIQSKDQIAGLSPHFFVHPKFARPCPTKPRHGFIDSRQVRNADELTALWHETIAADPDGEIMIMPYIDAMQSMILTPRMAAVGLGHAGATSGDQSSVTIPVAALDLTYMDQIINQAGISDTPYFEILQEKGDARPPLFVQLRDGVAVESACDNIIPQETVVQRVMTATPETDWAKWEVDCATAKPGTVVHHPALNPISHFAIHAVMNKLPLIFGNVAPKIGDTLTPTSNAKEIDLPALQRGLRIGRDKVIHRNSWTDCMRIVFYGTHHAVALKNSPVGCMIIGAAAMLFARFGAAACLGELRHHKSEWDEDGEMRQRDSVYEASFADYESARHDLKRAWNKFTKKSWPSGIGGAMWGNCTLNTMLLDRAITAVCEKATQSSALKLVVQLNTNVHLAHNGGWWLNKFTSKSLMDYIAGGEIRATALACFACAPIARSARVEAPLEGHARISLPALPPALLQIAVGSGWLKIQYRAPDTMIKFGKQNLEPGEESALLGFISQLRPPKKESMQGGRTQYYQVTPAFAACIELSLTSIFERLTYVKNSITA